MCKQRDACFSSPCADGVCVKELCQNIECEMRHRNLSAASTVAATATSPTEVKISGQTISYYHKQLMQEAAMKFTIPVGIGLDVAVTVGGN